MTCRFKFRKRTKADPAVCPCQANYIILLACNCLKVEIHRLHALLLYFDNALCIRMGSKKTKWTSTF